MRKSFFFIFLILMYVSLFLMPKSVFADTYNFTFQSNPYSHINSSSFDDWKQQVIDYRDSKNISNLHYFIFWSGNKYQAMLGTSDYLNFTINDINTNYPVLAISSPVSSNVFYICNNNGTVQNCGGSTNDTLHFSLSNCNKLTHTCDDLLFLDSDISDIRSSDSNVSVITYNDETFTFPNSDNLYTSVSWYNYYHGDDYPLLTQFFTLFVEKLVFVTEYISSHYIFLSMFTIFIIYFSILLIRRFL